jgi:transglutaminase-like putative cysteine protease
VPERFGSPTIVEPARYTQDLVGGANVIRFTNVGQSTGISLLFGDRQMYDVALHYHIDNSSQNVAMAQVALPPDTAWQTIRFTDMNPQPSRIFLDSDGNWIGEFRVAGQAQAEISARAMVTVWALPRPDYLNTVPVLPEPYWRATPYWDTNNATIKAMAGKIHSPEDVYRLVVDTLQYNYHRFDTPSGTNTARRGAAGALADPSDAVCQEFTDVFVTLARAAHIPARRITGYAVVQNSRLRPLSLVADVLHAWPEYYDTARQLWVPTDPTWADTTGGVDYFHKFDLRHIAFAIQGMNDQKPLPAGMYKISGQEQKDVEVKVLGEADPTASGSGSLPLLVERGAHWVPRWGLPTQETFTVRNNSGAARYNIPIAVGITGEVELLSPAKLTIPVLLPWSDYTFTVQLNGHSWWRAQPATLHLFVDNQENQYEVAVRRSFTSQYLFWLAVGSGLAFMCLGAGSLLVFRFRRTRAVRR